MTAAGILTRVRQALGDHLVAGDAPSPRRVYVTVGPEDVVAACRFMFEDLGARFQIASGVDTPDAIEVLYHWALDKGNCVVTVRTCLDRERPEVDSVTAVCPATEWIEREMWELLGIRFRGHPDLRHLLLDDTWPAGRYPLRRDFEGV